MEYRVHINKSTVCLLIVAFVCVYKQVTTVISTSPYCAKAFDEPNTCFNMFPFHYDWAFVSKFTLNIGKRQIIFNQIAELNSFRLRYS